MESGLNIVYSPLSDVQKADRNPKNHDIGEINVAIKRFGYIDPIVIDSNSGQLVSGHGRVDALQEMKDRRADPPDRIKVDDGEWLIPVLHIPFSDPGEAEAYLLASNRLTEIGGWSDEDLGVTLLDHEDDLEGTGFDSRDIDRLIGSNGGEGEDIDGDEDVEVEFTEELHESSNYIVLYFDNDIDWLQALSVFDLKSVKALDSKKGFEKKGIGRVINGPTALNTILKGIS